MNVYQSLRGKAAGVFWGKPFIMIAPNGYFMVIMNNY
jgi:hypothetical protein